MDPFIKKFLTWTVGVLAIMGIGYGGAYYYINQQDTTKSVQSNQPPSNTNSRPQLNSVESLNLLDKVALTAFPKIDPSAQQTIVTYDKLPSNLQFFLPEDKQSVKASEVVFTDKSKGNQISFKYTGDLLTAYRFYRTLSLPKYDFLEANRGDEAAQLYVEDSDYRFKIDILNTQNNIMDITITSKSR